MLPIHCIIIILIILGFQENWALVLFSNRGKVLTLGMSTLGQTCNNQMNTYHTDHREQLLLSPSSFACKTKAIFASDLVTQEKPTFSLQSLANAIALSSKPAYANFLGRSCRNLRKIPSVTAGFLATIMLTGDVEVKLILNEP